MRKEKLLCEIVGTGVLDGPSLQYTAFGQSAEKHLNYMSDFYEDLKVEKYVIMPNHIHLLIHLLDRGGGPSGRPVPTSLWEHLSDSAIKIMGEIFGNIAPTITLFAAKKIM